MNNENNQNNQPTVNNTNPTVVNNTNPTVVNNSTPTIVSSTPTNNDAVEVMDSTTTASQPEVKKEVSSSTPTAGVVAVPPSAAPVDASTNNMSRAEMAGISSREEKGYGRSIKELEEESNARRQQKKEDFIKKANEEYKPNSKFKSFLLIMFFIILIAFVVFLPDIHSFISTWQGGGYEEAEKITTGKLECTLTTNTENLNLDYSALFGMTDNKLYSLRYSVSTKGDRNLDADTLDKLDADCKLLKETTDEVKGVQVECKYNNTTVTQTQIFTYSELNIDAMDSAYSEAGGTYPNFEYNQDMDKVEKEMKANGYTCSRSEN